MNLLKMCLFYVALFRVCFDHPQAPPENTVEAAAIAANEAVKMTEQVYY